MKARGDARRRLAMRDFQAICLGVSVCAAILGGCRRDRPACEPAKRPSSEPPLAIRELTSRQKAAISKIEATGGVVTRDSDGFPSRIDLASERTFADEELVQAVLEFPHLKGLRLTLNSVSVQTLAGLTQLTELDELLLQDAALDDKGLADLVQSLPALRRLTLRRLNQVSNEALDAVAACDQLRVLALIELSQLTSDGLQRLVGMEALQSLDLRNCGSLVVEDLAQLAAVAGLVDLKLGGTAINDEVVPVIARLPALESLTIEDAQISGAFLQKLAAAGDLSGRVRSLSFARCYGVTDETLEAVVEFPRLESLLLRDIMVTGVFLEKLSEAGKGPMGLKSFVATKALLNDAAVRQLPTLMPDLRRLDLRDNFSVTDDSLDALNKLTRLSDLKLDGTGVSESAAILQ